MVQKGPEIGQGGHAVVYEGLDPELHRKVAIKVLREHFQSDPKVSERFLAEGRKMAALNHPNILQIYSIGEVEGQAALLMELADGTLRDQSERGGLSAEDVVEILRAVAGGLAEMARNGLYHRDVKPSNVLRAGGTWKVGDLGVARGELEDPTMLEATPRYLAPEVLAGMPSPPAAPDLYSLGLLAYELVAGERRVDELVREQVGAEAGSQLNWLSWQMSPKNLPPLDEAVPGTPAGLAHVVSRLLAKDPSQRYADYDSLLADLGRWQSLQASEATVAPGHGGGAEATVLTDRAKGLVVPTARREPAAPRDPDEGLLRRVEPEPSASARVEEEDEEEGGGLDKRLLFGVVGMVWILALAWMFWPESESSVLLEFHSTPSGAAVVIDGSNQMLGTTPFRHQGALRPGTQLRFLLEGYESVTKTSEESETRYAVVLEKLPEPEKPAPPPMPDRLPTARELAERIQQAGEPDWESQLVAVERSRTDRRLPSPIAFGTDIQFRFATPKQAHLLGFHLGADGTIVAMYPHLKSGNLRVQPRRPQLLPDDEEERIISQPPAGIEWYFVIAAETPPILPTIDGVLPMEGRWRAYPLETAGGGRPSVEFVEWIEREYGSGLIPFSRAWVEYEVADERIQ